MAEASKTSKNSRIKFIYITAAAAVLLLGFASPLDSVIALSLSKTLNLTAAEAAVESTTIHRLFNTAFYLIYAASGFVCARYLRDSARLIVVPQLIALTALLTFPFYRLIIPHFEPLSYFCFGLLGFSFGLLSLKLNDSSERLHSQQIESTLRNRQLLETRLQLIKQDEIERKMLAADLHDQVLNDLKLLLRLLEQKKDSLGQETLAQLNSRIELAMESIRAVMESLCPSDLEHIGLLAALEECLKDRAEKNDFIPQFRSNIEEENIEALNKIEKALIYRLVQESITNICKHAGASKVRLTADIENSELQISVIDNGVGLKNGEAPDKSRGLQYMRLRGEIIGARISWNPGPENKGTAVEIRMNLSRRVPGESSDS